MKKLATFAVVCTLVLALAPLATAQGMPPMPKPGPEHALFKDVEGTWDAKVESFMAPGAPPMESTGAETSRVGCGGLCLISDFKGSMGPMTFEGHGTETYDPKKKKYVGSWTDSMSTGLTVTESSYDAATKTMTGWMEGPDPMGNMQKMKAVSTMKDANTRVFSMYMVGPDGKENLGMRITYTRRK
jgi:hypothetical protein